jgi:hypothetical protein
VKFRSDRSFGVIGKGVHNVNIGESEPFRHHRDHAVRLTVQSNAPADNLWISAENTLPKRIIQNDDSIAPRLHRFWAKNMPQQGLDPQHVEQGSCRLQDGDPPRFAAGRQAGVVPLIESER